METEGGEKVYPSAIRRSQAFFGDYDVITNTPKVLLTLTLCPQANITEVNSDNWMVFYRSHMQYLRLNYQLLPFSGHRIQERIDRTFFLRERISQLSLFDPDILKRALHFCDYVGATLHEEFLVYHPTELDFSEHSYGIFGYTTNTTTAVNLSWKSEIPNAKLRDVFKCSPTPIRMVQNLGLLKYQDILEFIAETGKFTRMSEAQVEFEHAGHCANHSIYIQFGHVCNKDTCWTRNFRLVLLYPIGTPIGITTFVAFDFFNASIFVKGENYPQFADYDAIYATNPALPPYLNGYVPLHQVDPLTSALFRYAEDRFDSLSSLFVEQIFDGLFYIPSELPNDRTAHKMSQAIMYSRLSSLCGHDYHVYIPPHIAYNSSYEFSLSAPLINQLYMIKVPAITIPECMAEYQPGVHFFTRNNYPNFGSIADYRRKIPYSMEFARQFKKTILSYSVYPPYPGFEATAPYNIVAPTHFKYEDTERINTIRDVARPKFDFNPPCPARPVDKEEEDSSNEDEEPQDVAIPNYGGPMYDINNNNRVQSDTRVYGYGRMYPSKQRNSLRSTCFQTFRTKHNCGNMTFTCNLEDHMTRNIASNFYNVNGDRDDIPDDRIYYDIEQDTGFHQELIRYRYDLEIPKHETITYEDGHGLAGTTSSSKASNGFETAYCGMISYKTEVIGGYTKLTYRYNRDAIPILAPSIAPRSSVLYNNKSSYHLLWSHHKYK